MKTEQRNPRTRGLDLKSSLGIVRALNQEDATVALAVRRELPAIARAVDAIVTVVAAAARFFMWARERAAGWPCWTRRNSADVRHRRASGAGADRRGAAGAADAVEGAEDSAANGARILPKRGLNQARRRRRNRRERHDALRVGRARNLRKKPAR